MDTPDTQSNIENMTQNGHSRYTGNIENMTQDNGHRQHPDTHNTPDTQATLRT